MTCIAAVVHRGEVYMAGDSATVSSSGNIQVTRRPKVFRKDRMIIGHAGECRLHDLVEYGFTAPHFDGGDLRKYLAVDFVNGLRDIIRAAGHIKIEDGQEGMCASLLIGMDGRIVDMSHDFCIVEVVDDYMAIGSGGDVAIGSLHTTTGEDPVFRLMKAMRAAQHNKADVREPFTIVGPMDRWIDNAQVNGRHIGRPVPEAVP